MREDAAPERCEGDRLRVIQIRSLIDGLAFSVLGQCLLQIFEAALARLPLYLIPLRFSLDRATGQ